MRPAGCCNLLCSDPMFEIGRGDVGVGHQQQDGGGSIAAAAGGGGSSASGTGGGGSASGVPAQPQVRLDHASCPASCPACGRGVYRDWFALAWHQILPFTTCPQASIDRHSEYSFDYVIEWTD